jgi:Rod binding domain-containing protein
MTTQSIHLGKRHGGGKSMMPAAEHHAALVKQTQKWVSQTFFGTMLKQMRNSPFKSELFSGGRGGEAFNEMFDQLLADHLGKGSGKKLVDALVRRMEGGQGGKAAVVKKVPSVTEAIKVYAQNSLKTGAK